MNGKIYSISIGSERGQLKKEVPEATLIENHGIETDAHAGVWGRQVTCLNLQSILHSNQVNNLNMGPGDFAENLLIDGLDLSKLYPGSRLRLGRNAILEVTQIGKDDHPSIVSKTFGISLLPREGVFCRVIRGGKIKKGDLAEIVLKERRVSEAVIRRLPRYYRQLELISAKGIERISSSELAQQLGLNPSQLRQDLNCFGGFGQQGYGYSVHNLLKEIANILGLTRSYKLVIVGAGNIGQALCKYEGFTQQGFEVIALFDIKESLIGQTIAGRPILHVNHLGDFIRGNNVDIGIITARRSSAQQIADTMVEAGIYAIWNFVPADVASPVPVENVQLSDSMLVLSYRLNERD